MTMQQGQINLKHSDDLVRIITLANFIFHFALIAGFSNFETTSN